MKSSTFLVSVDLLVAVASFHPRLEVTADSARLLSCCLRCYGVCRAFDVIP